MLSTIETYPTAVAVCIISNEPQRLRAAMDGWADPRTVCGTTEDLGHPFELTFLSRKYMESAALDPGGPFVGLHATRCTLSQSWSQALPR